MLFQNRKLYQVREIVSHITGIEAELYKQKDRTEQYIWEAKDDKTRNKHLADLDLIEQNISSAHRSLAHMLKKFERQKHE